MALKCLYLQNGTFNALEDRMLAGMHLDYSSDPLSGAGRILSGLLTSAQGTPNMTVQVSPGRGVCPTPASDGGAYTIMNDVATTVNVAPVSTLPRVDLVVLRVDDADYSGAIYGPRFEILAGTPAASPVAPALPAGCLLLATLNHLANATSVAQSAIVRNLWNYHEAEYYATASQSIPQLTDRPIGYPVVAGASPDVTPLTSTSGAIPFGAFRVNRDGIWQIDAGCRFNTIKEGCTFGIWLGLDGSGAFRFAANFISPAAVAPGGDVPAAEFGISCTRRMGVGSTFVVNAYHNDARGITTNPFSVCNHIRLSWLRP